MIHIVKAQDLKQYQISGRHLALGRIKRAHASDVEVSKDL